MVLGSPDGEMKQIKVNAYGRVPSLGGNVAEPSRLWLDHVQRQDVAASFHEGRLKVEAASSRLPSMDQRQRQDAAATLPPAHGDVAPFPPREVAPPTAMEMGWRKIARRAAEPLRHQTATPPTSAAQRLRGRLRLIKWKAFGWEGSVRFVGRVPSPGARGCGTLPAA